MRASVVPFAPELAPAWDDFVLGSRNGTFHLTRRFIDYHGDRFEDASVVIVDEAAGWLAVVPAARQAEGDGSIFHSHPGLSYGGMVLARDAGQAETLLAFVALVDWLAARGYSALVYKTIPILYHAMPAQDDLHALFLLGAERVGCHVLPAVCPAEGGVFQARRRRGARRARRAGIHCAPSVDLAGYWSILGELLAGRGGRPVHSLGEIERLAAQFPDNIRLHAAHGVDGAMQAGVLVFESPRVARAQYIAATPLGKSSGALDLLFEHLLHEAYAAKPWFELGTATTEGGRALNVGILRHKEGLGARTVVQETFRVPISGQEGRRVRSVLEGGGATVA